MSFFDQPYYALTKAHVSRVGIWPEQSKYVRIVVPSTMFAIILTLAGPTVAVVISIKLLLTKMEEHWELIKNTPAVIVLDKYAEQGRYIIAVYSICIYVAMIVYCVLCLSPTILDFVDPVNKTRPKIYIVEAEYGVDTDKYYWFIMAHTYIVVTTGLNMIVAIGTIYVVWIVHACALFEVVGFNLELIANECTVNKENVITLRIDWNYKKICDCIILHAEAIRFADLIEDASSGSNGMVLGIIAIITVISGVQALINWKHPEVLIQQGVLVIGQVFHLYLISIPGQELLNHSGKVHTIAYNLEWQDMSTNAQKLLIPVLIRSSKPSYITAGKVVVLSMETFGAALRLVVSYFTVFAQMI